MAKQYDAIIVGAGPGGATMALYAERMGLNVLLLDKKHFPRDKICGDAISGKSVIYLNELGLIESLEASPQVLVNSVIFSSPAEHTARINFEPGHYNGVLNGYVCRREVYDDILFQAASKRVDTMEGFTVKDVIKPNGKVTGVLGVTEDGKTHELTANIVVGADGFSSVIARKMGLYKHEPEHLLVATRAYYRGITDLNDAIELHYIEAVMPGYFWIFPLDNGMANVGLGMRHLELKQKGVKLRDAHIAATEADFFKERFRNAELIGDIVGWNLPVGSTRREIHGDGFILIGDAAGLIDPFTGEGIGNAMCSAKIAAEMLAEACKLNRFDAAFLKTYSDNLWKSLGKELNLSYRLQRTARFKPLVNLVLKRAEQSTDVADWISGMMSGRTTKRELLHPKTYLKLLWGK